MTTTHPVLLLLPGMLNTDEVWGEVITHLDGPTEVVIPQLQTQSSIADMAADAWRQLDGLDAGRPLVLCGFSMGSQVAIHMLRQPRRAPAALVLVGSSARPDTAEGQANRDKAITAIGRDYPRFAEGVATYATSPSNPDRPTHMAALIRMALAVGPEAAIRQNQALAQRDDHQELLAQLSLPTWIVCGEDDRITPPALSEELAALIPGATLHRLAAAGHLCPVEQPQAVARVIGQALHTATTP